jgi:periplasmic divalent cation tolerance protein
VSSTDLVIVLTTVPATHDADALARILVDERLAACVAIHPPMRSVYRWEGQVEEASERQLLIKTIRARVAALQTRLHDLHPYELPEFLVVPVQDGSDAYLRWLREATATPGAGPL